MEDKRGKVILRTRSDEAIIKGEEPMLDVSEPANPIRSTKKRVYQFDNDELELGFCPTCLLAFAVVSAVLFTIILISAAIF